MNDMLRVACVQPEVFSDRKKCYLEIEKLVKNLLDDCNNCDFICLPERWVPLSSRPSEYFQEERGKDYQFIKTLAKQYSINILSGGIWEKRKHSVEPYITCYFFNQNGEEIGRQDKIHLYSYEKENFKPANELCVFKMKDFCFAILICFDMAFFETPRLAAENGANILFSPTQIREEGMKNWEVYLKARALENRIPVVGCNTYGNFLKRKFVGNSKIISFIKGHISPSKLRIVEAPFGSSGFIYDEIDLNFPEKLRKLRFKEILEKSLIKINVINI